VPTTRSKNIRVPDELWAAVQAKAAGEYTTASAVVVRLLAAWVAGDPAPTPQQTPTAPAGPGRGRRAGG